jgi:hypothetical protein
VGSAAARALREELREPWQTRVLTRTRYEPIGMVVLSVLGHSYDDKLLLWLAAAFPGFRSISTPFLCSAGKIDKTGRVIADVVWEDFSLPAKAQPIFRDVRHMEGSFRRLADRLKLNDADRTELFDALKKWVVADMRLDPNMNPQDPDAKRLTSH